MDWSAYQKELTEVAGLLGWEQITAIAERVAGILASHDGAMTAEDIAEIERASRLSAIEMDEVFEQLAVQGAVVASLRITIKEDRLCLANVTQERDAFHAKVAELERTASDARAERDAAREDLSAARAEAERLKAKLTGADGRAKLLLDAKNHWAERARAAEASQQALLAAGAEFQERLQSVEADRDGWKIVALRALVLNVMVRAQWERYMLAAGQPVDGCPGPGKCHGSMAWCDRCGDVGLLCDMHGRCVLHLDRWTEHVMERAPVAKLAREEGHAAGRREAGAERIKEVEELRARLRRARTDAWFEAVDAVIGAAIISEEAYKAMAPVRAHIAALLKVVGAVESAIADIAEKGTGADSVFTSQAHAKELLAIIRAKHPGAEWLSQMEEREQAVQPFLALARDRLKRVSYEPIALDEYRRLLAAFNAVPEEEQQHG